MALIHNILLRGLNCIYLQAPNIQTPRDIQDFMLFCDAWSCTLHSHHKTEETVYFPLLDEQCAEKGVASKNHDEHETFLSGLIGFDKFVKGVREGGSYEKDMFKGILDDLGPKLEAHLISEIGVLESLEKDEGIDWDLLGKTMAAQSKKVADRVSYVYGG
jgi:hemerythrin-like domain-containing protein